MSLKLFVVAIFASLLVFTAEAQEQRSNHVFVAEPIDKTPAVGGESQGQRALSTLSELVAQALRNNPEIQAAKRRLSRFRQGRSTQPIWKTPSLIGRHGACR